VPYLTPATIPTSTLCRRLRIPDDPLIIAAVNGAITELTKLYNWEQFEAITPAQITAAMLVMWLDYEESSACLIGSIVPTITDSVPYGMLACDGASYLRVDYPELYAVLASAFVVDADNFIVPDLRGRTVIGTGTGTGLTARAMNASAGVETHQLSVAELASHSHADLGHTHVEGTTAPTVITIGAGAPAPAAIPAVGVTGSGNANLANTGADTPHENMQPSLALRYCVIAK